MNTIRFSILSAGFAVLCLATGGLATAGQPSIGQARHAPGVHREAVPQRAPTQISGASSVTPVRNRNDAGDKLAPRRAGDVSPLTRITGPKTDAGEFLAPRRTQPWSPTGHALPVRPKSDAGGVIEPKRTGRVSPQDINHDKKIWFRRDGKKTDAGALEPRREYPWSPKGHALPVRPKSDAGGAIVPKRKGSLKACEKIRSDIRTGSKMLPGDVIAPKRDSGTVPAVVGRGGTQVEPVRPRSDAGGHLVPRRIRGR